MYYMITNDLSSQQASEYYCHKLNDHDATKCKKGWIKLLRHDYVCEVYGNVLCSRGEVKN